MTKGLLNVGTLLFGIFVINNVAVASQNDSGNGILVPSNSVVSGNLPICSRFVQRSKIYSSYADSENAKFDTANNNERLANVQIFKPQSSVKLCSTKQQVLLGAENKATECDAENLAFAEFFKKYPNPEFLVIIECDGITQTIQALNAEKAIINAYYSQCENLDLFGKVSKWVGISYGSLVSGANVGTLSYSQTIDEFNSNINNIINCLIESRTSKYKWYSCFTNCMFNSCLKCVKFHTTAEDLEKIRESQFDQIDSEVVHQYIADYFPVKTDASLICLKDGTDRKRIDPDYQNSYTAVINDINNTASSNNKNVIKKNVSGVAGIASIILDTANVPIAGAVVKKVGELAGRNLDFKAIENTKNSSAYKEMLDEIFECGTFKLIINVDNSDHKDVVPDLQVEYKPSCNKLKYRLTVNIPYNLYQDEDYNFNDGYDKILNYLNRESISYFISPINEFINNIGKTEK